VLQRGLILNDDPQDVECVLRTVRAVWRAVEAVSPDDPDPTAGLTDYGALDERSLPKQLVAYPFLLAVMPQHVFVVRQNGLLRLPGKEMPGPRPIS
jgi:hypothetical protein